MYAVQEISRNKESGRKRHNVRVIPDASDVEIVGADSEASAETSKDRANAAWDQRIVIMPVAF